MDKKEIYDKIIGWIDAGKLVQKSNMVGDGYWYMIWKSVGDGKIFFTGKDRVIATDMQVRDEFQKFLSEGRVMSTTDVTIRHPECTSVYAVNKLVEQGVLLKINKFSSLTLYVE